MWLFAGVLALPLIEIALFVTVGGWLGLWLTLAIVIGSAVGGVMVIRWQGGHAVERLRAASQMRRDPLGQMAGNALVLLGGTLLILPGFLTDTAGLLLLVPQVRGLVIRGLSARVQGHAGRTDGRAGPPAPHVIDGEYFEIEPDRPDDHPPGRPPSGWTQH